MSGRTHAACNCLSSNDVHDLYEQSAMVFSGEIIEILPQEELRNQIAFHVEEIWKGTPDKITFLLGKRHTAVCETGYVPGIKYLIYAIKEKDGKLSTASCGGQSKYLVDVSPKEMSILKQLKDKK